MRLSKKIIDKIKTSAINSFGDVDIYLFGSRTDDTKKGGDIDIAVDINLSRENFRRKKIKFLSAMLKLDFDYKIDIVPYNPKDKLLASEIKKKSILF